MSRKNYRVSYTWIVRLRLDAVFFAPFPALPDEPQRDVILSFSIDRGQWFYLDSFNVGPPQIMHPFLDRVFDFGREVEFAHGPGPLYMALHPFFIPEDYVKAWTSLFFNGTIQKLNNTYTFPFRWRSQKAVKANPLSRQYDTCAHNCWTDLLKLPQDTLANLPLVPD